MEERKFATVVFADFVGSTAIGGAYDPEVVRTSFGSIFARMRDILEAHGGTVEKFIGDAVMAVFGVPIAHEDDALRALHAAFALRSELARGVPGSSIAVSLRVGVSTGEVVAATATRGDFLVTGTAVNIGARLQAAAEPGQILVGPLTRELTAARIRYGPEISVPAKGAGMVSASPALEVRSEPTSTSARGPALIDREAEMRVLAETYARVRTERTPCLVTLYGAPGVGKSRLATEFVTRHAQPLVRRGRCVPYGDGVTLPPLQNILRTEAQISGADDADAGQRKLREMCDRLFAADADEGRRVFSRLAVLAGVASVQDVIADVPEESLAQELDWALRRYLEERSADGALALVFEDVQWAEPALLDTIEYVVEWTRGAVFILCLARPEFLTRRQAWGGGRRSFVTLALRPLSAKDTRDLVVAILPRDHALAVEGIIERSEGNPFYAEELVRLLVATGESLSAVPATLQGLIAARLDAADPGVKALLQRASVVGRVFWTDALTELGAGPDQMPAQLLDAIRQEFVVSLRTRGPGGGSAYRFTHALTRDVAYASLAKTERSALHDRLSRWLERVLVARGADELETIASHAERSFALATEVRAPQGPELARRAFELVLSAARAADARADVQRAESLFRRALGLGEVIGADARSLLEPNARVAIARLRRENTEEALVDVRRVLEAARSGGTSEILAALLRWSAMYAPYASPHETDALYDEAIEVARALGDAPILAAALRASARPLTARGDLSGARRLLIEAGDLLTAGQNSILRARVLLDLASNSIDQGAFGAARAYIEEARPIAHDLVGRVLAHRKDAELWYAVGDVERAGPSADAAIIAARELGSPLAIADAAVVLGGVLRERGEHARSRAVLDEALAVTANRAPAAALWRIHYELARTALAAGELERARVCVADLARSHLGEPAAASLSKSTSALVAAADGRITEAIETFAEAAGTVAPTDLGLQLASVRLDHANALIAAGRAREARPQLTAVRDFFVDPLAARRRHAVERLLATTGPRERTPAASAVEDTLAKQQERDHHKERQSAHEREHDT